MGWTYSQDTPDFCRTRCWEYSPQRSVGNPEEMNAIPASVPDRMCVLQLHHLCMSSWVWANFTLANLDIDNGVTWTFGQAENHRDERQECATSWVVPLVQRSQFKLPSHLWRYSDIQSSYGDIIWWLRRIHLISQMALSYVLVNLTLRRAKDFHLQPKSTEDVALWTKDVLLTVLFLCIKGMCLGTVIYIS